MKRTGSLMLGVFFLLVLLACSTTGGTLLEDTAEQDRSESARAVDEGGQNRGPFFDIFDSDEEDTGVRVRSTPSGADVYLNNRYIGITPVLIDDLDPGTYKVTLRLDGYYSESEWLSYSGDYESLYFDLEEITGFLKVDTVPTEAEINYGGVWVPTDRLHELAIGSRIIRIRAFGYEEERLAVEIAERRVTALSVTLREADFRISALQSNRTDFNPRNAGLLGSARVRFRVSSYGQGRAVIRDSTEIVVFSRDFERFTTWQQSFEWNGRGTDGTPLPDGSYTVRMEGTGERRAEQDSAELGLLIDSSIVLSFRSLWSGSAGLLYAPTADILPGRSVQLSSLVLAHASGSGDRAVVRIPVSLGIRLGLGQTNRFELDTSFGGIIGYSDETFYLPWFASAAFKTSLMRPTGGFGFSSAAQAKLTYQNTNTDTLANFRGLSVGLPTGMHVGPFSLLFSPEAILSWEVVGTDPLQLEADGRVYGRFGLLLDLPPFSVGASVSLRSLAFDQGLGLGLPFQSAVETHWLIPNTQLFVSASLAGEFSAVDDFYLFGGLGLGILN